MNSDNQKSQYDCLRRLIIDRFYNGKGIIKGIFNINDNRRLHIVYNLQICKINNHFYVKLHFSTQIIKHKAFLNNFPISDLFYTMPSNTMTTYLTNCINLQP